ncbi:hypothetical protein [Thalassospira lucentensis]|uniref:hypothetical protein n=1 Tax=Thalassospira lucentensis TaxID=168935 RepID=UPI00142D7CDE|nr:hypothetical protein [Thalassospira lucentensis]NIZ00154.1 hypothetical protein [Thalassospira lucentensis]
MKPSFCKMALLSGAALLTLTSPAYAYLDPGTGSIILQAVVGAVAALSVGFAAARQQIKAFFAKLFGKDKDPNSPEDE